MDVKGVATRHRVRPCQQQVVPRPAQMGATILDPALSQLEIQLSQANQNLEVVGVSP
jgi:hypothetical protein